MARPALIFDFGNVVAGFDYLRACERIGRRAGVSGPELMERLGGLRLREIVQAYECGRTGSEEFAEALCALAGLDVPYAEFAAAWADIFWLNEPVAQLVRDLSRQGYVLVLGSNTNALHATQFRRQFAEVLGCFQNLVLSYEVGHAKPAGAFYEACVQAAGQAPGSCVFIDDLAENVAGARAAGLVGLWYRDVARLKAELRRLGIEAAEV